MVEVGPNLMAVLQTLIAAAAVTLIVWFLKRY